MKNIAILFAVVLTVFCTMQSSYAANTGPVHALEGMAGGKYSGAPSQALAGRLGMTFEHLRDDLHTSFEGIIADPVPIHELGYPEVLSGDPIRLIRTGENTWTITHIKSGKEIRVKVVS
jgi:hypothetical protein